MSLSELTESPDPLAEEAGVLVHRTVFGLTNPQCQMRMAHLLAKAAILLKADIEKKKPSEVAARLTAQFSVLEYSLPAGTRRRK